MQAQHKQNDGLFFLWSLRQRRRTTCVGFGVEFSPEDLSLLRKPKAPPQRSQRLFSPRVIDFFTWWYGGPIQLPDIFICAMPHEFTDVEFIRIQVGLPDVANEFRVHTMRTFVLLKKGEEVDRVVGTNIGELRNKIEKHRALQA